MDDTASDRVYRVTVRGRFHELRDEARRQLASARAEHDIFRSAYTPEGTLTYDARIDFFNLRYEVRAASADDAATHALVEADTFLRTMRYGARDLRPNVVDVSAIWDDVDRRRPTRG